MQFGGTLIIEKTTTIFIYETSARFDSYGSYSQAFEDALIPDEEEFSDDTHVSVNHRLRRTISLPADLNVFRGDNRPPFLTYEMQACQLVLYFIFLDNFKNKCNYEVCYLSYKSQCFMILGNNENQGYFIRMKSIGCHSDASFPSLLVITIKKVITISLMNKFVVLTE